MKILDAGHAYRLDGYDGGEPQTLAFMKRCGPGYPFNEGARGGTNCQEVLRALIDRTEYLHRQIPCAETEGALACLKTALLLYEVRAARRHGRSLDLPDTHALVRLPTCRTCGHVGCDKHDGGAEG